MSKILNREDFQLALAEVGYGKPFESDDELSAHDLAQREKIARMRTLLERWLNCYPAKRDALQQLCGDGISEQTEAELARED